MEQTRIIEILDYIIHLLSTKKKEFTGICAVVEYMTANNIITSNERKSILFILNKHKPTPTNYYKRFTQNNYWLHNNSPFWWLPMNKNLKVFFFTLFNARFRLVYNFSLESRKFRLIRILYLKTVIENIKTH